MNIDELNAKYDEIFAKNTEIQQLFTELEDYNEILFYLYDTEIKRPNAVLNTMIDDYEALIFKIRESHKEIRSSLDEFGDEKELANGVTNNENLTEKVKELILWKLRRLFMVYDEEPILPYVESDFLNTDLIGKAPSIVVPAGKDDEDPPEDISPADEPTVSASPDVVEVEEEEEEDDRFADDLGVTPEAGLFPNNSEDKN